MATITHMFDTVEGSERLLESIRAELHEGNHARARERAVLLVKVLESSDVECCVECGVALLEEERDRFTSWCAQDAPRLGLRCEG